jgi:chemotaxis protein CheY-P-specific phosphatase CheC
MNSMELTSQERTFMDRLGRFGGRMSATALSHIPGHKVNIKVNEIFFIPLEDIQYMSGDPDIVIIPFVPHVKMDMILRLKPEYQI